MVDDKKQRKTQKLRAVWHWSHRAEGCRGYRVASYRLSCGAARRRQQIMDMRENHLSYRETARKYNIGSNESQGKDRLRGWERIYLEEGAAGLMAERRGRKSTGRPRKQPLNKSMEEDLIAENQRLKERIEYLEAENEYIKKLSALVYAEEQKSGKKRK